MKEYALFETKIFKILLRILEFYQLKSVNSYVLVMLFGSFFLFVILFFLSLTKKINISSDILYRKNLTIKEKINYDKPDNLTLFTRVGSQFLFQVIFIAIIVYIFVFIVDVIALSFNHQTRNYLSNLYIKTNLYKLLYCIPITFIISLIIRYTLLKKLVSKLSIYLNNKNFSKIKSQSEITDIRDVNKFLQKLKAIDFNPEDYFNLAKKIMQFL